MNGSIRSKTGLAVAVLAVALALPASTAYARDDYRGAGTVAVGYRGHHGHGDRHHYSGRHGGSYGHAYGHYAWPRYPAPYYRSYSTIYYAPGYYAPRYYMPGYYAPGYYAPRYYDYGGSGWDIDLRYHFSDRW